MTDHPEKSESSTIWGGRFNQKPSDIMEQINASIDIDKRLWAQDIRGSIAHCDMLAAQEIITQDDSKTIIDGLQKIAAEITAGEFIFKTELEDIHMNIESRLKELVGDVAGRLHTARSRNDQVATAFRLWTIDAISDIVATIEEFQDTLDRLSKKHHASVMPGFTHLQSAQPVTLGKHINAYKQMMGRDKSRFQDAQRRTNESPLGAAALAGTPFPIDRERTAKALGFESYMTNTMDAVSARDFANEFLFDCAQCGLHLSRLAEEIIIWATPQFGFITLSDQWSTGSSIMPQKKNPDAAELVRAKTGRLNGNLIQLMTVMKALPLTYNKDMQEDKAAVFESYDTIMLCLKAMNGMMDSMTWHTETMHSAAEDGFSTATRLADWLVMTLDMPFRDAHHVTGAIVKTAEQQGKKLRELDLKDMQKTCADITDDIYRVLKI